jgi:hypothetical protein
VLPSGLILISRGESPTITVPDAHEGAIVVVVDDVVVLDVLVVVGSGHVSEASRGAGPVWSTLASRSGATKTDNLRGDRRARITSASPMVTRTATIARGQTSDPVEGIVQSRSWICAPCSVRVVKVATVRGIVIRGELQLPLETVLR